MAEKAKKRRKRLTLEIRPMEIDDLATVFHLGEQIFTPEQTPNTYRTWDEYEVIGMFQDDPEFCLVAEVEGELAGFVLGTTITKSRSAWKYGYLIWLGVNPAFQRNRVADKLFRHFRDLMLAAGVRIILVDMDAENHPALKFFQRMGFRNPEEHIYLSLNLDTVLQQIKEKQKDNPKRGKNHQD